jgi:RNA polymerase sigma-70 factor, ECF subfamily
MSNPDMQHASGDHQSKDLSIEDLMAEFYDFVYRLTYSILLDRDDAEDAVQETFIHTACNLGKYRGEADIRTWLYAIALNVCRKELRKRKSRLALQKALQALLLIKRKPPTVEEIALHGESNRQLWRSVANLDEKHRAPVILRYIDRMTIPQIAQILGVREGTVHSRLHYARQKLFKNLEDDLGKRSAPAKVKKELIQ